MTSTGSRGSNISVSMNIALLRILPSGQLSLFRQRKQLEVESQHLLACMRIAHSQSILQQILVKANKNLKK